MKTWFLFAVAALLMSFSGCEREKNITPASVNADDLTGSWTLVKSDNYKVTLIVEPPLVQTWLTPSTPAFKLSGESSVNQYNSTLSYETANPAQITIGPIGSTKKAGSAEGMQFEQAYYTNLKAVNRYELTDKNRLKFYYPGGVLTYEKIN